MANINQRMALNTTPGSSPTWSSIQWQVPLVAAANSFTSAWLDKRGSPYLGVSVVFYGLSTGTGTLTLQTSNDIPNQGGMDTFPAAADDALTVAGSSLAVATGNGGIYQWSTQSPLAARWVRVVYTASVSQSGLTASVYMNAATAA